MLRQKLLDKGRRLYREGYYADLVLVNPRKSYKVATSTILYKCGWSPLEGEEFSHTIEKRLSMVALFLMAVHLAVK